MKRQDFDFELPESLIAQYPLPNRADSRLLVYRRGEAGFNHHQFPEILNYLKAGDLLVMNNSKVIPARLYGQKASGGRIECLVERLLEPDAFLAHIKASKAPKPGTRILFDKGYEIEVVAKQDDLYHCRVLGEALSMLTDIGHVPLPPYIKRSDENADLTRYQTVYAKHPGSVAAPTAGLHFDERMLEKLKAQGINIAHTTLHVGAGTFQPVRVDDILSHKMHGERIIVDEAVCEAVKQTKARGGRVICVGTTSLRAIESASQQGEIAPFDGETHIFIYPGYRFKVCDGLVTNFHLPESTLLMLVSALIGHQEAMALYREAIDKSYRFFSYGDTSLLL